MHFFFSQSVWSGVSIMPHDAPPAQLVTCLKVNSCLRYFQQVIHNSQSLTFLILGVSLPQSRQDLGSCLAQAGPLEARPQSITTAR